MMAAPTDVKCTCKVCTKIRVQIDQIFRVLDVYGWLLNSYVVDFFQDNLWEKLPGSWRLVLQDTTPPEFGRWLTGDISCTRVWPLSLLALRQVTNTLQLNRDYKSPNSVLSCAESGNVKKTKEQKNFQKAHKPEVDNLNPQYNRSNNVFSKRVKKKKQYEIQEIAHLCANCTYESNTKCIVDIGAGMGHLARALAFQYGLCVACIEQDCALLEQARKCDQELLNLMKKQSPGFNGKSPQHVAAKLESSHVVGEDLINQLQTLFKSHFNLNENEANFGFVGLHPCGDLASTLLQLYTTRKEAKFICIVGCCYMKLTVNQKEGDSKGYPLSEYLLSFNNPELSYTSLEIACHANEKYCDKLMQGDYKDLIVHAYRAALEIILIKKSKNLRHSQVKNVKVTKDMTFEQYCADALSHLETCLQPQSSDINNEEIKHFLSRWQQVIIFGSLRLMLAPLVETVVLLDRFLFLSERHLAPILKPVFDARLSPRNLIIISMKSS